MAVCAPFARLRYSADTVDITALTAPPYDVVSDDQREALAAARPAQRGRARTPPGPLDPPSPATATRTAERTGRGGRPTGTLVRDDTASLYVVEQRFEHAGTSVSRTCVRRRGGARALRRRRRIPARAHAAQGARRPLRAHQGLRRELQPGLRALRRRRIRDRRALRRRDGDRARGDGHRRRRRVSTVWRLDDDAVAAQLSEFMASTADIHRRRPSPLHHGARLSGLSPREGPVCRRRLHRPRVRLGHDGARQHGRSGPCRPGGQPHRRWAGRIRPRRVQAGIV